MREHTDTLIKPFEMPYLSDTAQTWGLEKLEVNASRLAELMQCDPATIWSRSGDTLYHAGTRAEGDYFLAFEGGAKGPRLDYLVHYEQQHIEQLGSFVTQVQLWRSNLIHYVTGSITKEVFFEVLMPAYKTIVSDEAQTTAGKAFWERQLNEACQRGYVVGMVDERGTISACSDYEHFVDWFSDPRQQNGWGGDFYLHGRRRFFITDRHDLAQGRVRA